MNEHSSHHFWGMLALAIAIVISAFAIGGALAKLRSAGNVIAVTGSARQAIRADYIVWHATVSSQKPDMQEAYHDVKRFSERVRSYLKEKGVPDSSVTFNAVENERIEEWHNGSRTGKVLAYRLAQRFDVHSRNVDAIAKLSNEASDLINEGIPLESNPPQYLFTKLAEMRVEMMAEATKDAKLRAQKIAESAGTKIGPVRSARMGVFQITPRNSTEISDYGMNDTSSLEKDITAVVSLSFAAE
jgi:uncharacterized protein